uniref:hypothetical protein n=1 Tax=Parerythrobacter lutipelagi TaxID=1964208 RepID=UPI0010F4E2D7|nr:hypothetical protein [Parerythrobacter lutipelagi]
MKKIIATAAAIGMAATIGLSTPAAAQGQSDYNKAVAEFCKAGSAATGAYSPGECVRFYHTEGEVQFCNYLKTFDLLEVLGFPNVGQCIKALRS